MSASIQVRKIAAVSVILLCAILLTWTLAQAYDASVVWPRPYTLPDGGRIDLTGHLRSGFRSASNHEIKLRNQISVLRLEYPGARTSLYIGRRYFASGEIVFTDRLSLEIAYQKDSAAGVEEREYTVTGTELSVRDGASRLPRDELPVAILVHWTPSEDGQSWHATLTGELSTNGAPPEVYVPYVLPTRGNLTSQLLGLPLTVRDVGSVEKPSLNNVECLAEIGSGHSALYRVTTGDTRSVVLKSRSTRDNTWTLDLVLELASAEQRDRVEVGDRSICLGWKGNLELMEPRIATKGIDSFMVVKW
jgi:hypothetical protein